MNARTIVAVLNNTRPRAPQETAGRERNNAMEPTASQPRFARSYAAAHRGR